MNVNIIFICVGNPKPQVRPLKEYFSKNEHVLLKKLCSNSCLSIFGQSVVNNCQYLQILDNLRQYTVLRTYLPTIRYCVRI